jgi:hypothetical protein
MIDKLDWIEEEQYINGLSVGNKTIRLPNHGEIMHKLNEVIDAVNQLTNNQDATP